MRDSAPRIVLLTVLGGLSGGICFIATVVWMVCS